MKKKLMLLGMTVLLISVFVSCGTKTFEYQDNLRTDRFVFIERGDTSLGHTYYYKDNKTNIIYIQMRNGSAESLSPLYNASGTPMTYDEYINENK